MPKPKLHLDADCSEKALWKALVDLGHDVTRTPQPGLPLDAHDDEQLRWATRQERVIFTYNIQDFIRLAKITPNHGGIILAKQRVYSLSQLIILLNCVLTQTTAEEWGGRLRWLSDWKAVLEE